MARNSHPFSALQIAGTLWNAISVTICCDVTGMLTPTDFVRITSTAVAQAFNVYPRKGVISPGSDADIIVLDPEIEHTISASSHHSTIDQNIYEGRSIRGKVTHSSLHLTLTNITACSTRLLVGDVHLGSESAIPISISVSQTGPETNPTASNIKLCGTSVSLLSIMFFKCSSRGLAQLY